MNIKEIINNKHISEAVDPNDILVFKPPVWLSIQMGCLENPEKAYPSLMQNSRIPIRSAFIINKAMKSPLFFFTGKIKENELILIRPRMLGFYKKIPYRKFEQAVNCLGFSRCFQDTSIQILLQNPDLDTEGEFFNVSMTPINSSRSSKSLICLRSSPKSRELQTIQITPDKLIGLDEPYIFRKVP